MKKVVSFIMVVVLLISVLCLASCNGVVPDDSDTSSELGELGVVSSDKYEVTVSYAGSGDQRQNHELVRERALNNKKSDIYGNLRYPIYKMDTKGDLDNFKSDFKEIFVMNQPYDELPSFEDAVSQYDEEFFESNSLFIAYLGGTSSSNRFDVSRVYCDGYLFKIDIRQINNPEVINCDEVGYFFTVAIADSEISGCQMFDAE